MNLDIEGTKIIIPGELPGMNEIIRASKSHYHAYNNMKREHTENVAWLAKATKKEYEKIDLEITWYCKNRRKDKDNIMAGTKFILDGLVMAGVIENDGWRHVGSISHDFKVDRDNPRIEVIIKEVE